MKMSKKTAAVLLMAASITTGAFAYNSGIILKPKTAKTSKAEVIISDKEKEVIQDINTDKKAEEQVPPVESTPQVKETPKPVQKPAPKPIKKTVTAAAPKKALASRGATSIKTATKTTTVKTAAKSTAYTTAVYKASAEEIDLLSRLVSAEAGGESFAGKLAVATVIMNRVKSPDYPNTITGVIYDKNWGVQFTPIADGRINNPATTEAKSAAEKVLNGYRSFEPKVMFFVNPSKSVNMYVINNKTYYKTIGLHKFYY